MNIELIFRISLGILIAVLALVRFRFIGWAVIGLPQPDHKISTANVDKAWYRLLWMIGWFWVLTPILYVLTPGLMDWSSMAVPVLLRWLGVGLGVISIIFLAWAHRALGRNWDVPGVVKAEQALVTDGPYHWLRHPMYTSFALIAVAYWLISTNWLIAAIGFIYWLVVISKVNEEEEALIEKFGDTYREYRDHTGRFLPHVFSRGEA